MRFDPRSYRKYSSRPILKKSTPETRSVTPRNLVSGKNGKYSEA
jgi:hypothetical protein